MGATAGHMLHPYENLDLTFDQLRGMFDAASKGFPNIKVTEKTDGQNIAIGYDIKARHAIAIRNKSHAKAAGLDKESLKRYFTSDRIAADKTPTPDNVVDSFYDAMKNFEIVASSLSPEFFLTPEGKRIFYNAEVMDPRSANVIDYDTQVLLIHRVGHKVLTEGKDGLELVGLESDIAEQKSIELENRIEELQAADPSLSIIKVNAIVNFTDFIEKKEAYRDAVNELRVIQGSAGTVGEYLENRVLSILRTKIGTNYSEQTQELLLKALMYFLSSKNMPRLGAEIKPVLDTIPEPEKQAFIKDLLKSRPVMKDIVDSAVKPLTMVIHNFAVKLLNGFASGYTVQSDVSLGKLRKKVGAKAKELADPKDLKVLKTSMQKILGGHDVEDVLNDKALETALESITTSIEGLVFDYDGITYKFTGQFAPVNQMMGLGKFDRGAKKANEEGEVAPGHRTSSTADFTDRIREEEGEVLDAGTEPLEAPGDDRLVVAVVAGGFKPPHAGHYGMAKYYSSLPEVDEVRVIIGKMERVEHTVDSSVTVTAAMSKEIWELYTENDPKISVMVSPDPQPIQTSYDILKNELKPGDKIIMGMGAKDAKCGDQRFSAVPKIAADRGVEYDCSPITSEQTKVPEGMRATDFRKLILAGDRERFFRQLPGHVQVDQDKQERIWSLLLTGLEKKITNESISSLADIRVLVKEVLSEKYVKRDCKKESGESGGCAVIDHNTSQQKACYDDCEAAKKVTHMNEEEMDEGLRDFFKKGLKDQEAENQAWLLKHASLRKKFRKMNPNDKKAVADIMGIELEKLEAHAKQGATVRISRGGADRRRPAWDSVVSAMADRQARIFEKGPVEIGYPTPLEELSSAGGGGYDEAPGASSDDDDDPVDTIIREEEDEQLVTEVLNYILKRGIK